MAVHRRGPGETLAASVAAQLGRPLQQGPAKGGSKCAPVHPVWLEVPRGEPKAGWCAHRHSCLYVVVMHSYKCAAVRQPMFGRKLPAADLLMCAAGQLPGSPSCTPSKSAAAALTLCLRLAPSASSQQHAAPDCGTHR